MKKYPLAAEVEAQDDDRCAYWIQEQQRSDDPVDSVGGEPETRSMLPRNED